MAQGEHVVLDGSGPETHAETHLADGGPGAQAGERHLMFDVLASEIMRTTLEIADDVLQAARERARNDLIDHLRDDDAY
jgi:hypothetical protein